MSGLIGSAPWQLLPPPHDAIEVRVSRGRRDCYTVEYLSSAPGLKPLLDAGCLDADAFNYFAMGNKRKYRPAYSICCTRSRVGSGWKIVWNTTAVHARTLPGVASQPTGGSAEPDHEAEVPRRREVIFTRYPRPVRWTVIGKLITIDWQAVQAAAISGREAHSA